MEEESVYNNLIEKYSNTVYKIAKGYLRNNDDAEDIVQEVFIKYVDNKKPFNNSIHEKNWLIRVTVNMCKNEIHKSKIRKEYHKYNYHENNTYTDDEKILLDAMNSLSEKYRIVCDLHYYQDFKTKEIGEILGIKETAVRKRLERARDMIKNYYGKVDDINGKFRQ